ncbi:hypothetical protein [Janibacter sp. YB324]|uniref:hypothetical protein n=1 Tax=Janibacter sp. YB324 TaxID=2761047 RepID=UPI00162328BC|nr:hypothetical protein [Janibacter sp. YB324]QNF92987.1 hypothetical protein H7A72_09120 [Janibacter sp. YB324]
MTEQEQPAQSLCSFILNQRKKIIRPTTPTPTKGEGTISQDEVLASIFDTLLSSQDSHAHPSPPTNRPVLQGATSSSYYCDGLRVKLADPVDLAVLVACGDLPL